MTAIPDAINLTPSEGAGPAIGAVQPTDFGLAQAGADIGRAAAQGQRAALLGERVKAAVNARVIAPLAAPVIGDVEKNFAASVGNGETSNPGFVQQHTAFAQTQWNNLIAAHPELTPEQTSQLRIMADTHVNALATQAYTAQADALQKQNATNLDARREIGIANAQNTAFKSIDPASQAAHAAAPIGGTDLAGQIGGIYDEGTAAGLQTLQATFANDPQALATYNLRMATARTNAMGDAAEKQAATTQQQVIVNLKTNINAGAGSLQENPSEENYNASLTRALQLVSQAPPGLQPSLTLETKATYASAYFKGLLQNGMAPEGVNLLKSGKYNEALGQQGVADMLAMLTAGAKNTEPTTGDQAVAQAKARAQVQAEYDQIRRTGQSTGDLTQSLVDANLGTNEVAAYGAGRTAAFNDYNATEPVRNMTTTQLRATAMSLPPAEVGPDGKKDPDWGTKYQNWQTQHTAAAQRLDALAKDPAGTVLTPVQAGDQASIAQTNYARLNDAIAKGDSATAAKTGHDFATATIYLQAQAQVLPGAMTMVSNAAAQALVAGIHNAETPEQRASGIAHVAAMMQAMPAVSLPDGTIINAGQALIRDLKRNGLTPAEAATLTSFGDNPAALNTVMRASADPQVLKGPPPGVTEMQFSTFKQNVSKAMAPWLAQQAHLGGAPELAQARIDLATTIARHMMYSGAITDEKAAIAYAVKLFSGGDKDMGHWSIPTGVAASFQGANFWTDGAGTVKAGADALRQAATANNGANLAGPDTRAAQVAAQGQWRNRADGTGLQLYTPRDDGSYAAVVDKYGRAISASWAQLHAIGVSGVVPAATFAPPPNAATAPNGAPVPAFNRQAGYNAVIQGVQSVESSGVNGQIAVDPKTGRPSTDPDAARGLMQIKPTTADPVARQLFGAPVDNNRLQNDAKYNTAIGQALIRHSINETYGPSAGGLTLAIAEHFAGPGNVKGFLNAYGDPRDPTVGVDRWLDRVEARNPKTAAYVREVSRRAFAILAQQQHAGGG